MSKEFPEIYFSYAWGDPALGKDSIEYFIDELYHSLNEAGYPVKRDKMNSGYGDLISDFMKEIGEADLIVIGISDKYLRSNYCMWELCEIYRNSNLDANKFIPKLLPIRIEDINFEPQSRKKYIEYWDERYNEINKLISDHPDSINAEDQKDQQKIRRIRHDLTAVIGQIKDINSLTKALLKENDFTRIKKEINSRTGLKPIKGDDFQKGKIVHNIPKKMQVGIWIRCKIKISSEISHFDLDDDFKEGGFSKPSNLAITELMKVEIKGDSSFFEINALTDPEMYLEKEEATTWLYDVKPLRLGNHTLTLMAYTMKNRGKRNAKYYEAKIEVISEVSTNQRELVIDDKKIIIQEQIPDSSISKDRNENVFDNNSGQKAKHLLPLSSEQKQHLILNFIKDKGTQQYSVDQLSINFTREIPSYEVQKIVEEFVTEDVFKKLPLSLSGYWIYQNESLVPIKIEEIKKAIRTTNEDAFRKRRRNREYFAGGFISLLAILFVFLTYGSNGCNKSSPIHFRLDTISINLTSVGNAMISPEFKASLVAAKDTLNGELDALNKKIQFIIPDSLRYERFQIFYDTKKYGLDSTSYVISNVNIQWKVTRYIQYDTIKGKTYYKRNTLPSVIVNIENTSIRTESDHRGAFKLTIPDSLNLPIIIKAKKPGYRSDALHSEIIMNLDSMKSNSLIFQLQDPPSININGLKWMINNLNIKTKNSIYYENLTDNQKNSIGLLYTFEGAKMACSTIGWRLPTDSEWTSMFVSKGGFNNLINSNNIFTGKNHLNSFNFAKNDLRLLFGGIKNRTFNNLNIVGYYWSATVIGDDEHPILFYLNKDGIYRNRDDPSNYLSCRCVQN